MINIRACPPSAEYVYIGRAGHGQNGYFGSPIVIGTFCPECHSRHDRSGTLACFERYARKRLARDAEYARRVKELHGLVLGCFCDPMPCHGHVLERLAAELNGVAPAVVASEREPIRSLADQLEANERARVQRG